MHFLQPLGSTAMESLHRLPLSDDGSIHPSPVSCQEVCSASPAPPPQMDNSLKDSRYVEQMQSLALQQSEATSLSVITNDGDQITISMVSEWQLSMERGGAATHTAERPFGEIERYQGYAIQYRVEGELDEGERQALDQLIGTVSQVANEFFEGDLAGALSELEAFELDTREFTAMAMVMKRSVRYSMVESYREVSEMAPALPVDERSVNLPGLSRFIQDVQQMVRDVDEYLDRILSPEAFVFDLMGRVIERDPRVDQLSDRAVQELHTLLEQIVETMVDDHLTEPLTL